MGKTLKFAMIGGVAGAGMAVVQAKRADGETDDLMSSALKTGGEAAAAGLAVGFVLDRRAKKKAAKRATIGGVSLLGAARLARPAFETAVDAASQFADAARPKLEHAADAARPKMKKAAKAAKSKASDAADAIRPKVEHLAEVAAERAGEMNAKRPILVKVA